MQFLLEKAEDMAFSEENQQWILDRIQEAIHPSGWRKIADRLRYWGLLGIAVTAFLSLIGIVVTLGIFSSNRIGVESEFRGRTDERLKHIDQNIQTLTAAVEGIRVKQASGTPTEPQSIKEAQNVLQAAQTNNVQLSNDTIADAGKRFIEASSSAPQAWDAALRFLDYRSFLNEPHSPDAQIKFERGGKQPGEVVGAFSVHTQGQLTYDVSWPTQLVPISQSYIYEPISGMPEAPGVSEQPRTEGHQYLLIDNPRGPGAIVLDGRHLKNIILRDMRISYSGGPIILENVYFVNCTFEIVHNPIGQKLANAILLPNPATNFTA